MHLFSLSVLLLLSCIDDKTRISKTTAFVVPTAVTTKPEKRTRYNIDYTNPSSLSTTTTSVTKTTITTTATAKNMIVNNNNVVDDDGNNDDDDDGDTEDLLVTATIIANHWIRDFSGALSDGRVDGVLDLFVSDPNEGHDPEQSPPKISKQQQQQHDGGKQQKQKQFPPFWRDMVAYTWNIVTLEGQDAIRDMLQNTLLDVVPDDNDNDNDDNNDKEERCNDATTKTITTTWKLAKPRSSGTSDFPPPLKHIIDDDNEKSSMCEFWCDISTSMGTGYAHVRLDLTTKRAKTVLTTLTELHDRPFQIGQYRPRGTIPGPVKGRQYFRTTDNELSLKESDDEDEDDEEEFHVVIVGAGQAGLSLAARLEAMKIPYVLFEAGSSPGWTWRKSRYPSLHLHDPVWYQHMPYIDFPKTWPIFTPKDKLADWFDAYATILDLNIRTDTKVVRAIEQYYKGENNNDEWRIETIAMSDDGDGEKHKRSVVRAKNVVFATGNSSRPRIPNFAGASSKFRGVQLHTSRYTGGAPFQGRSVVVVGSNNSGLDICQDLWEQGASSVTMIQRTGSMIVSSESVLTHGLFLFNESPQYHHEHADLLLTTTPYRILVEGGAWKQTTNKMKENDAELIARVEASGYKFEYGYDGTGLFAKSATEGGGFYIDVGCAELLARGDVQVRYANVERLESDAVVVFNKDTRQEERLPADVIIYATGFDTMESHVKEICGTDVATRVGTTWGLGLNYKPDKDPSPWTGELRNMWKPTNVDGLWFHGGNLAQCRHYSRFLALQLAARYVTEFGADGTCTDEVSSAAMPEEPRVYGIPPATVAKTYSEQRLDSVSS